MGDRPPRRADAAYARGAAAAAPARPPRPALKAGPALFALRAATASSPSGSCRAGRTQECEHGEDAAVVFCAAVDVELLNDAADGFSTACSATTSLVAMRWFEQPF